MKSVIYFLATFLFLSSCAKNVSESDSTTYYVADQDSVIVVYEHESTSPIILYKPVSKDKLDSLLIPNSILLELREVKGMRRYIDGAENDVYDISFWTGIYLYGSVVLIILLITVVFFKPKE